jgi:hypothetical protein
MACSLVPKSAAGQLYFRRHASLIPAWVVTHGENKQMRNIVGLPSVAGMSAMGLAIPQSAMAAARPVQAQSRRL